MDSLNVERMRKVIDMPAAPLDKESFPTAVDEYGRTLDPTTILHVKLPRADEPTTQDSIFSVPRGRGDGLFYVTVQDQLEMLYQQGFRGRAVFNIAAGPHPETEEKDQKIVSRTNEYPSTECRICTALIAGKERMSGYKLLEFKHAGQFGCPTCTTVYRGTTYFAGVLDLDYEDWESNVRQNTLQESKLLSDTVELEASLIKDDEEVASLAFMCTGEGKASRSPSSMSTRIADSSSYTAVRLVREWMNECLSKHDECNVGSDVLLPSRLLVVSNHRVNLVDTEGLEGTYLALSHSWGPKPIITTIRANIEDRMADIPWVSLSKTFQDAIIFTWKLGYRYIWIDSLCIVQDDKSDWETQASRMAQIFSNADLTISASRAKDGSEGCFSIRSQEPFKFTHHGRPSERTDAKIWSTYNATCRDRDGIVKDISIRIKPRHGVDHNHLLQRAWVFQEQILSPRIIHFAAGELYWECKSYVCCECAGWEKRSETLALETHRRKAYNQLIKQKPTLRKPFPESQELERKRDFEAYRSLIEQYTTTNITRNTDRLPALSGITFGRPDEYLAGMWRSILIESLHWSSMRNESRVMAYRPTAYRAPSWSWAAVESPIQHIAEFSSRSYEKEDIAATVLSASCTPEGKDARGEVSKGYLKIQGLTVRCRVGAVGVVENPGFHDSDSYAKLVARGLEGVCNLDIPVVYSLAMPAEVRIGEDVLLLRISGKVALVLGDVLDTPGAFRRVGIFWMRNDSQKWFRQASSAAVFVL